MTNDNKIIKLMMAHVRFKTKNGLIMIEDLVDLPLTSKDGYNLNEVAKTAAKDISPADEEDYVGIKTEKEVAAQEIAKLKLEVIKDIIEAKKNLIKSCEEAAANKTHNDKIDKLIEAKREERLSSLSVEELEKLKK